ncbi:phosphatase domain-containing putative toxin [Ralstonia sp. A12]|uniref:phosphatase domain-containing putative toxin n=1 Tax=Ralstonia sp. A12 TaxID=1217052 RepID=UPI0018DDAFB9|nr:ATP-binding cassette domain-containing protein [Ralstonia sp. A12]
MSASAIQLLGFSLSFGRGAVLDRLNLSVPSHGCTVLLGPSGTGKSSLLYCLAGRLDGHPHVRLDGEARYFGKALKNGHRPALVEQKPHLLVQSVRESLVSLWPRRDSLNYVQQTKQLVQALCSWQLYALADKLDTCVIELALHEQRMVAILRKWLAEPGLLMVDEPTAELSDIAAAEVLALINRLKRERPILVVSHHLQQTRQLADHVLLLASGCLQEASTCSSFFEHPRSEATRQFIRTGSCPELARDTAELENAFGCGLRPTESQDTPPRRQLAHSVGRGPEGFVWLLPGQLAGTPWPGAFHPQEHDLQALRDTGVTRLLSLTEAPFSEQVASAYGLKVAFEPIPDRTPPTITQAERLCRHIDAWLQAQDAVAVHCHAGLGRTGTVLAAYLLWRERGQALTPDASMALQRVRRLRWGMVQTHTQERFLFQFAQRLATSQTTFQPL